MTMVRINHKPLPGPHDEFWTTVVTSTPGPRPKPKEPESAKPPAPKPAK
jgi:hypothetical protein